MDLDYDSYFEYHDQTYIIIDKIANYYGLELKDLRWNHFKDYAIDVENIEIIPYRFGEVLTEHLSGNIIRFDNNYGISFNSLMNYGRQRFSILHELGHFYFDMDQSKASQSFSDLLEGNGYSEEDFPKEARANVFASLTMINNEALKECFRKNMSFEDITVEFGTSKAALYVRIFDFLTKLYMLNPSIARQALNNYRYSGDSSKILRFISVSL
ncbi:hypothetical protein UAY_01822 [Enterococcus moraviensis ATCC BAA-383]|uniref:IrrE N-terminal-like domain-containing protein n=1 Tax=Enterococcus moraviensis ATCC BAA-383 TaxID=1158609 RepID=R2T6P3_9ENTE|nr:ImmA/IrrE family metallo-endopeptidase [Enterococcus moraviensis]EOI00719.1 hypothetical protein UAY_01822 [Enterococcus moraviensis ATCC BAA-383]EOT73052.1 hypothetical protein I586_00045 [Enterococcus moraviensis ATCC BAA-383]OJG68614.1 hypothetical protein RV09_GL000013 [Enterococcus moraviensis]